MNSCGQDERNYLNYAKNKLGKDNIGICDVGWNYGDFTELALEIFPNATVYGFEPIEEIYLKTKEKFSGNSNVYGYNVGLSDEFKENVKFYYLQGQFSGMSSVYFRNEIYPKYDYKEIEVNLITLDSIMDKVGEVDYLKEDTEGGLQALLEGGYNFISRKKPRFIQFEIGFCLVDSHTTFKEAVDYLYDLKYVVYDQWGQFITPQNVWENYEVSNYLAELIN